MADITMPQLGETVTEGTITRWLKQVGEAVAEDEVLFEVSTDKVDSEVPSPSAGYVTEILVPEGATVDVGTKLAVISAEATAGEKGASPPEPESQGATPEAAEPEPAEPGPEREPEPQPARAAADSPPPSPATPSGQRPIIGSPAGGGGTRPASERPPSGPGGGGGPSKVLSPVVRRLIAEHGLDPGQIEGTGAGGRITRADVLALIDQQGAPGGNGGFGTTTTDAPAGPSASATATTAPAAPAPGGSAPGGSAPGGSAPGGSAPAGSAPGGSAPASVAGQRAPAPAGTSASDTSAPGAPSPGSSAAASGAGQGAPAQAGSSASDASASDTSASDTSASDTSASDTSAPGASTRAAPAPAAAPAPSATAGERDTLVPFTNIRRRTAEHMVRSKQTSAHTVVAMEVDFATVERARQAVRDSFRSHEGFGLTYLPFVSRSVIDAIAAWPHINSSVGDEQLIVHNFVNLGIAVDLNFEGLLVPVIHDAGDKRLRALAREIASLAERARSKRLTMDDISGGTFTITNAGPFGTLFTIPVINQPQVAILATDGVRKKPVVVELADGSDSIAIHPVGNLVLSFDHRAVDGAYASGFMRSVKQSLETRDWSAEL